MTDDIHKNNQASRAAWNTNAAYWDERMGEGNDFVNVLVWPATHRLLNAQPNQRILEVATGNGLYARKLAALGARVTAFDFAENLIERARRYPAPPGEPIDYRVLDATDEPALLALGEGQFDAAVCSMALMDMADIQPLFNAVSQLLKPDGRFVFSVMHPCFNGSNMDHVAELIDRGGDISTVYSVKVSRYLSYTVEPGIALRGQPVKQVYFHRPLHVLFGCGFKAGLALDGLEEPSFPPDDTTGLNPLSWGRNYSEIPPVLVARMVKPLNPL